MKEKSLYGRLMSALTVAAMFVIIAVVGMMFSPSVASATTVSKSFTTHSQASDALLVFGNETLTYSVSGTFVGVVKIQRSLDATSWQNFLVFSSSFQTTPALTGTIVSGVGPGAREYYRMYASTHTSGTIVTSLADVNDPVRVFTNNKGVPILTLNDDTVVVGGSGLTGASISDGEVVTAKLASDSVTGAKIADGGVGSVYKLSGFSAAPHNGDILCVKSSGKFGFCSPGSSFPCTCN